MKRMTMGVISTAAVSALLLTACGGHTGSAGTDDAGGRAEVTDMVAGGVLSAAEVAAVTS